MNYPLISEYVEAIKAAEDNFDQLKHLRPVLDDDGMPVMSGGNFAVVFKMKDEQTGKLHAVKCFLKEQEGRAEAYCQIAEELEFVSSTFLTPIKYLDKELFVDSANSEDSEFPVLLMDWVEGQTLDKYIREHIDDQYELSLLAYQFSRLAMWLMPQPFAHGDLKPDNILVKEDGTLVLVDYDGMYVPAMKGQKARELGSPDFRHPGRTEEVFDDHIDDFSLASILLSLKAIALQPSLLEEYGASDRLLFSEKDYRNLSESSALGALQPLMQDAELASLYSLYILALSQNNLSQVSFRLFNLSRPDRSQYEEEGTIIENGILFTNKKKQLLKLIDSSNVVVTIPRETQYVKDDAFIFAGDDCKPHFIRILNDKISLFNTSARILVPNDPVKENLVKKGFCEEQIIVGDIFIDQYGVVYSADKTTLILYPNYLEHTEYQIIEECNSIEEGAFPVFGDCDPDDLVVSFSGNKLETLYIPSTLKRVGNCAFDGCMELKTVIIPKGTETDMVQLLPQGCEIVESDFDNQSTEVTEKDLANAWTDEYGVKYSADRKRLLEATTNISHYSIKDGTRVICNGAFECCVLKSVNIPQSVCVIGELIFCDLNSLKHITVDVSNRRYDSRNNCNAIIETASNKLIYGSPSTIIPPDIEVIGDEAFSFCESIKEIVIPSNVKVIGRCAFAGCKNLKSISIPDSVSEIRDEAFLGCKSIHSVIIPKNVRSIGHDVFGSCHYLSSISVDENNTYFDSRDCCNAIIKTANNTLIAGCSTTTIPTTVIEVGDSAFFKCQELKSVKIPNGVKRIGYNAFEQCHNIKTIFISATINVIEYSAFCKCENIVSIVVDKENNKYDSRGNCNAIVETNSNTLVVGCNNTIIPSSITSIGAHAFCGRKKLVSIALPKYIKEIRENAFNFCESLNHIIVPQGELSRFEKISPSLKGKFVEKADVLTINFDSSIISMVDRCRVFKTNNDWNLGIVYKNGMKIEYPHSLLEGNQSIVFDKQTIEKIQLYVGYCEGFYINPKAVKVDFEYPSKFSAKILFDSDFIEISGITWGLNNNINEWKVKGLRSFNIEERLAVNRAEVVPSDNGNSVCFFMNAGGQTYIPLDKNSELCVGDALDMNTAKIITLCRKGKSDIVRVME